MRGSQCLVARFILLCSSRINRNYDFLENRPIDEYDVLHLTRTIMKSEVRNIERHLKKSNKITCAKYDTSVSHRPTRHLSYGN